MNPHISVITATYNDENNIVGLLNNMAQQSYPSLELIIVDGDSTDRTPRLISQHEDEPSEFISEPDDGIYDAWNKGLELADGEWIAFLGADDRYHSPNAVERMVQPLSSLTGTTRYVYGRLLMVDNAGHPVQILGAEWEHLRKDFMSGVMTLPHPGMFHHKTLFQKRGVFDPSFTIAGDFELLLRELKHTPPVFVPNVLVTDMETGGTSQALHGRPDSLLEAKRALRKHQITGPHPRWWWAYLKVRFLTIAAGVLGDDRLERWLEALRRQKGPNMTDPKE